MKQPQTMDCEACPATQVTCVDKGGIWMCQDCYAKELTHPIIKQ